MAQPNKLLTITQKLLNIAPPNLVTFNFYLLGTFQENQFIGVVAAGVLQMGHLEELIFLFHLKTREMQRRV